jgi:hypothetical protein
MVGWAIEERLVNREDNPASRMERHLPKKRKADRVLSIDEVRAVWLGQFEKHYGGSMIPTLFKNLTKCEHLASLVRKASVGDL